MSGKTKLKKTQATTRQQAAARLSNLAGTLAAGGAGALDVAGEKVALGVADQISTEFEVETGAEKHEVEIDLSWAAPSMPGAGATAPAGTPAWPRGDGGLSPVVAEGEAAWVC